MLDEEVSKHPGLSCAAAWAGQQLHLGEWGTQGTD